MVPPWRGIARAVLEAFAQPRCSVFGREHAALLCHLASASASSSTRQRALWAAEHCASKGTSTTNALQRSQAANDCALWHVDLASACCRSAFGQRWLSPRWFAFSRSTPQMHETTVADLAEALGGSSERHTLASAAMPHLSRSTALQGAMPTHFFVAPPQKMPFSSGWTRVAVAGSIAAVVRSPPVQCRPTRYDSGRADAVTRWRLWRHGHAGGSRVTTPLRRLGMIG